jgi:sec-independent protein translocase protein TatC
MGAARHPEDDLPRMTLPEHLDELRRRLIIATAALVLSMVAAFVFWKPIWGFVKQPYYEAVRLQGIADARLWSVDPGEGFLAVLKLSFLAGVVAASPVIFWQLWAFVAAGLYPHERRLVRIFFPISLGLFLVGMAMAYELLIPFGLGFLLDWNVTEMEVASSFRIQSYLSICLTMVFGMAVSFQLPLVMLFLTATGMISRPTWLKYWRHAVVVAFIVGMLLTDPSPVSQFLMATPLCGLYFLGIWGTRFAGEGRERFRWWKAWPILLAALVIGLLLFYADEITAWTAKEPPPTPAAPP